VVSGLTYLKSLEAAGGREEMEFALTSGNQVVELDGGSQVKTILMGR
jgi:hypothetical protein